MNEFEDLDWGTELIVSEPIILPKGEQSEPATKEHQVVERPLNNGITYLVTIKCHAKCHIPKEYLDDVLKETVKKLTRVGAEWSSIVGYEEDSIGRMHLHTICKTQKPVFLKKLQKPGWSIHFQTRKDGKVLGPKGCLKYVTKLKQSPMAIDRRFNANYYRFINRFLPSG